MDPLVEVPKEIWLDLQEKHLQMTKLTENKSDPEEDPYRSKYDARLILFEMKKILRELPQNDKTKAMLAAVYVYLGTVSNDVKEFSKAKKHLKKCETLIPNDQMTNPQTASIAINMLNQFGLLFSSLDPQKAKSYLEKAEELYTNFKATLQVPIDIPSLFVVDKQIDITSTLDLFEESHTLTLYYLAQIHGDLEDKLRGSIYCHLTLQRELETNKYDPIEWAINTATLAQYFLAENGFKQARHHMAASSHVLDKYRTYLEQNLEETSEEHDAKMETLDRRCADVARCWAKYGLQLLNMSKQRLLSGTDDLDTNSTVICDLSKMTLEPSASVSMDDLNKLEFDLDLSRYEDEVDYHYCLVLEDAILVFRNVQKWLDKAEEYYTLENQASDYIEIELDRSEMYLRLIFFDEAPENQTKLHKRRIDLLENVLNNINSQYYMPYCRQIWMEAGQSYCETMLIKLSKLRERNEPSVHAAKKINGLIDKGIRHFTYFMQSFKEDGNKRIGDDQESNYLRALFYIASLHERYIPLDKKVQLANVETSLFFYKKMLDYIVEHKVEDLQGSELGTCKEMVELLPLNIKRLKRELASPSSGATFRNF